MPPPCLPLALHPRCCGCNRKWRLKVFEGGAKQDCEKAHQFPEGSHIKKAVQRVKKHVQESKRKGEVKKTCVPRAQKKFQRVQMKGFLGVEKMGFEGGKTDCIEKVVSRLKKGSLTNYCGR